MRIGIFSRYIAKTLITFFLSVVSILTLVIFMNYFIRVVNMAMAYGTDLGWIISSLLNILPTILSLSAPMAFQIAVLLTLTSMSEQGELIALRAAGFSFREIIRPLMACAVGLSVILLLVGNWGAPRSYRQFLDLRNEAYNKITKVTLEPKMFIDLGEWDLYLEEIDEKTEEARQIHLINKADNKALSTKVNASRGKIILTDTAIGLQLQDGQMQRIDAKDPTSIIAANFDNYTMSIALTKADQRRQRVSEQTTTKLIRRIRSESLPEETLNEFRTEISVRNVLALSPILMLLVSCPLGFSLGKRSNKGWGMLFSIVIIFSFYLLMTLGLSIGKKYAALSYISPCLPYFVGAAVAKYLWKKRLNI